MVISNSGNDWLNPTQLPISWDPQVLGGSNVKVNIKLMGYREDGLHGEEEVGDKFSTKISKLNIASHIGIVGQS